MSLEKTLYMNRLFGFYGDLLTNTQKEYMTYYYSEDYSLVEIAELKKVSRQAVYDNIKRSEKALSEYEEKLSMFRRFGRIDQIADQIIKEAEDCPKIQDLARQIKNIDE